MTRLWLGRFGISSPHSLRELVWAGLREQLQTSGAPLMLFCLLWARAHHSFIHSPQGKKVHLFCSKNMPRVIGDHGEDVVIAKPAGWTCSGADVDLARQVEVPCSVWSIFLTPGFAALRFSSFITSVHSFINSFIGFCNCDPRMQVSILTQAPIMACVCPAPHWHYGNSCHWQDSVGLLM